MPSIINATTSTGLVQTADNSGSLQLQTNNGTTAVTIDTSQRVGIGTSSPTRKLSVNGDIRLGDGGGTGAIFTDATNGLRFMQPASGTSSTESMRIDSSGNVGIGTSSPTAPLTIVAPSNGLAFAVNGRSSDNLGGLYFYANNGTTSHCQITASASEYRVAAQSTAVQTFYTNGTERMRITSGGDLQFNSGYGSVATAYGCRAWVTFNGTNGSIVSSGNVSSVSRNSTGQYTVNFATAMPDANYAVSGAASTNSGADGPRIFVVGSGQYSNYSKTTTAFNCQSWYYDGNHYDAAFVYAAVHR